MLVLSREREVWWMGREVSGFIFGYQTGVHLENADSSDSSGEKSSVDFSFSQRFWNQVYRLHLYIVEIEVVELLQDSATPPTRFVGIDVPVVSLDPTPRAQNSSIPIRVVLDST